MGVLQMCTNQGATRTCQRALARVSMSAASAPACCAGCTASPCAGCAPAQTCEAAPQRAPAQTPKGSCSNLWDSTTKGPCADLWGSTTHAFVERTTTTSWGAVVSAVPLQMWPSGRGLHASCAQDLSGEVLLSTVSTCEAAFPEVSLMKGMVTSDHVTGVLGHAAQI